MADLITVDEFREIQDISTTADDILYERLISHVSSLVKTYCNSGIIDNAVSPALVDTFDIQWDTYTVQLRDGPVISVQTVKERTAYSEAYTTLVNDGTDDKYEYYVDTISDSVLRTNSDGTYKNFAKGVGSVEVTYTAGYTTTPKDLQLAVADLVVYYHKNEHKERMAFVGNQIRNPHPWESSSAWPAHIRRVLDMYKVVG